MGTSIFVNLPVKDLKKTMAFFKKLGFKYNKQFTDKKAACMVIEKNIFAMLLVKKFFKGFIPNKEISNSKKTTEAIFSFSMPSKKKVDQMVEAAVAAGGIEQGKQDLGFMYSRSFEDLDGHLW
ncbi:MAG: glyoxalase/bleomycin resistance/extradiol dioxygenase family protein, partial [Candidatus Micrarchaeota archaeon]|nr:glyoxalase/bleomycin resistance/extradiol dioxygenase family protein [Candidatus Micrarchaeota archaeon]